MKALLDGLLPRLLPSLRLDDTLFVIAFDGKADLRKRLRSRLRAWPEHTSFIVMRDNDGGDCKAIKADFVAICADAGRPDAVVRIVCQALEAWYFGDPVAVAEAFGDPKFVEAAGKSAYRDSDAIVNPHSELKKHVPYQKVSGSRVLAAHLDPERSRSGSFQAFWKSVARVADRLP